MLFRKIARTWVFGGFSNIYVVAEMRISLQIFKYTHSLKWIPLRVKSRCCSACAALTQCILQQPFLKLTQNKEGSRPPSV